MFLEFAGEVEESKLMHRAAALKNAIEEANVRLAMVEMRPSRQAKLLPLAIVTAMEEIVTDETCKPISRAMRFDDTRGTPNRSLELRESHLVGVIHKSKTSGPGKKILLLPFYISKEAWVSRSDWLMVGFRLWNQMRMEAGILTRDFMLAWPNVRGNGFVRRMADYSTISYVTSFVRRALEVRGRQEGDSALRRSWRNVDRT